MSLQSVLPALKKAGLIGSSIIPSSFSPSVLVSAQYTKAGSVELGNTLSIKETQEEPAVSFTSDASPSQTFTLALLDPDAPSRTDPKWSPFLHWIKAGLLSTDLKAGSDIVPYMGPAPPPGTGPHRYALLVYRETKGKNESKVGGEEKDRKNFGIDEYVKENGLELVGANFFFAEDKSE